MKHLRIYAFFVLLIGGFADAVAYLNQPGEAEHIFAGIAGPDSVTAMPAPVAAQPSSYRVKDDSALAILLTDPASEWLGLAHGFKSAGIPFTIASDAAEATRHKVVLVYPALTGALGDASLQNLMAFVRGGGTLIGFNVQGGPLPDLFGFKNSVARKALFRLRYTHPPADADALEKEIPIDNPQAPPADYHEAFVYRGTADAPRAVYENGGAAILDHRYGAGRAVAFGFDLGALLLKGYNNRQENMARSYDNGYEPALDVLLRDIETIYREGEPRAVTLAPVPGGKKLAVILTHDIDYTRSLANAIAYARFEHAAGIKATYFMQTKYIRDYNDDVILNAGSPAYLAQLRQLDMEIASHTVAHAHSFVHFPLGDGHEAYPAYHPFVESRDTATGGTILGELRVSRFLIEQLAPGATVESFRPGYLSDPYALPQALQATGYRYSSSVTANDSLTHLPFQLDYGRETRFETPIFEFPISIADGPPLLTDRLPEGVDLAKKIARRGGLCVVLIHPDVIEPKLGFEKQFVAGVKDFAWFGTIADFGHWWEARNDVRLGSRWQDDKLVVRIDAPRAIAGLTLTPPAGMQAAPGQSLVAASTGQSVTLARIAGTVEITFAHSPAPERHAAL
jgi:hypothetical protein